MSMSTSISSMRNYYNVHTIWLAMMLLTLTNYAMGKLEYSSVTAMLIVLLSAGVKAAFIIRDFMELRGVSLLWRIIMYGWLWVVCITIAAAYLISL